MDSGRFVKCLPKENKLKYENASIDPYDYRNVSQLDGHVGVVESAVEEDRHRQHEVDGHCSGEQRGCHMAAK